MTEPEVVGGRVRRRAARARRPRTGVARRRVARRRRRARGAGVGCLRHARGLGRVEWIVARFDGPRRIAAVRIVETYHPGALVRVDDVTSGSPTALWTQRDGVPGGHASRVLEIELPTPRVVERLRLVLDTSLVADWNEIDAIGVLPAPPAP